MTCSLFIKVYHGYCRVLGFGGLDPPPLLPPPLLLPLPPPLGGLLLPLSLPLGGVGLFSVGGGLLSVGGGGVDCVGQLALVSITEPSGHVFVVGGVNGCSVCVHDGSFGFILQSTGGGVPVQLFTHVEPVPEPPDDANDFVVLTYGHVVLSLHVDGAGGGVIPCSFASPMSQSLVLRFLSRSVTALLSGRSHFSICVSHFPVIGLYTSPGLQLSGTHLWAMESM